MTRELVTLDQLDAWVRRFADLVADQRAQLTALDSAIGDADHGINMERGMEAVRAKLQSSPLADRLLAVFEGEEEDERALGRIFGEQLPSGLVLAE